MTVFKWYEDRSFGFARCDVESVGDVFVHYNEFRVHPGDGGVVKVDVLKARLEYPI